MTPEFAAALRVYESHIDYAPGVAQLPLCPFEGDFVPLTLFIATKSFPCDPRWRWSQSKCREEVFLPARQVTLRIRKLILRPHKGFSNPPSAKVWMFEAFPNNGGSSRIPVALWYHKLPLSQPRTNFHECYPQPTSSFPAWELLPNSPSVAFVPLPPPEPNIEDYKFLAVWMSKQVANEIWPNSFSL